LECPEDLELVGDVCKAIKSGCPPGFTKNHSSGACEIQPSCHIGVVFNPDTGLCDIRLTPIGSTDSSGGVSISESGLTPTPELSIPDWIKNTAGWWAERSVDDSDFTGGISYLIEQDIISIPDLPAATEAAEENVPDWVRNMAGWWADNLTTDQEFADAIKFLVEKGIIQVQT